MYIYPIVEKCCVTQCALSKKNDTGQLKRQGILYSRLMQQRRFNSTAHKQTNKTRRVFKPWNELVKKQWRELKGRPMDVVRSSVFVNCPFSE